MRKSHSLCGVDWFQSFRMAAPRWRVTSRRQVDRAGRPIRSWTGRGSSALQVGLSKKTRALSGTFMSPAMDRAPSRSARRLSICVRQASTSGSPCRARRSRGVALHAMAWGCRARIRHVEQWLSPSPRALFVSSARGTRSQVRHVNILATMLTKLSLVPLACLRSIFTPTCTCPMRITLHTACISYLTRNFRPKLASDLTTIVARVGWAARISA